jgi:quinolinate synthase
MDIVSRIKELKKSLNAVILAHNYVCSEVQDVADITGDSLGLSIEASKVSSPVILFAGVRFMAETAKILSPKAEVLLPVPDAGCPMADMADAKAVAQYRREHPDTTLVAYVNTTAAVKAEVDICCTSANADRVIRSLPSDAKVMFLPDRNLGRNTATALGRNMEYWPGFCPTHNQIKVQDILNARAAHPKAIVMAHPECQPEVIAHVDVALSTGGMLKYAKDAPAGSEFIVVTEHGIMHRLVLDNPDKRFYPLQPVPLCVNMKKITLESLLHALETHQERIELPEELMARARKPIERMIAL